MTNPIPNYEEQVYAGVLGKVVGVYFGRPFENWDKARLEEKWGLVNRYVHEDQKAPLVVSDDDISGTFTFIRALEDSGLYAHTPVEAFGDAWLNYTVEGKNIFWWGGAGTSTEHTAYLRLKQGYKAPASGSIALNGKVTAEQIGAQIFIDAFGLAAPGRPDLAVDLARKSASVSHDGEAVYAAMVVAAMISAAFVEKDMDRLLDIGASFIPADSIIAELHRDVRAWSKGDNDWRRTWTRIDEKYGPSKYWGGPHVVPNHAVMVLAWCYAPDDFQLAQAIAATSGWDTDCNCGNVGSVMGVKVGLAGINRQYDFQGPMADRILMPSAEGTRGVTDVLTEALHIARIGRLTMGWDALAPAKKGAIHHFEMPGALHGYQCEDRSFDSRGAAEVANVCSRGGARALQIRYRGLCAGRSARVSTPMLPVQPGSQRSYLLMAASRLCAGMTVTLEGTAGDDLQGSATAGLFLRHYAAPGVDPLITRSSSVEIVPGQPLRLELNVPDTGQPILDLGIEIRGVDRSCGEIYVDAVRFGGGPSFTLVNQLPLTEHDGAPGWVSSVMNIGHFNFIKRDGEPITEIIQGIDTGVLVTGTTDWRNYTFSAKLAIHMADRAGIVVRYQGLRRYIALVQTGPKLQLIREFYGTTVLAEIENLWPNDTWRTLRLECIEDTVTAWMDDARLFETPEHDLRSGGAGFLCKMGKIGFQSIEVRSEPSSG